jgi:predicted pyridoxine 5'-phosphate oxidase superfamily flavin-nucleotide-binding protein
VWSKVVAARRARSRTSSRVLPDQLIDIETCDDVALSSDACRQQWQPPPAICHPDDDGPEDPSDPRASEQLPGSRGEHLLQSAFGTDRRAQRFYRDQLLDHLNPAMIEFVARMEMIFVATSDAEGECDASLRSGPAGFVQVLDERQLAYPEHRGNGVMASLGNISENPHVGILMVDFVSDLIGLHVNGRARIVDDADLRADHPQLPADRERVRVPERWVVVAVEEAYIHCRKHIPRLAPVTRTRTWGTDDQLPKGGDFFGARATASPWSQPAISSS